MTGATKAQGLTFNPAMLTLRRESLGLTQSELAGRVGISQGKLSLIEGGTVEPSEDEMVALASALRRPTRFLLQSDQVYGPGVSEFYHRRRRSVGARALRQAHASINEDIMAVRRLLRSAEVDTSGFDAASELPEIIDDAPVEDIAKAVRAAWQLPSGPIQNVVRTLERAGCLIIPRRFPSAKIDAVSWWIPGMPPVLFVSDSIPGDRLRLTLCHEVGHLLLHGVPNPEMEKEADQFAGAFLLPRSEIRPQLARVSLRTLAALKPHWKVSMQAILVRAQQVGRVSDNQARYLWAQLSKAGYKRQEPLELDVPREEPRLIRDLLRLHLDELRHSPQEIADLLLMDLDEAKERYGLESGPKLRLVKT